METIKAGIKRHSYSTPKYDPNEEATLEDIQKVSSVRAVNNATLPKRIDVKSTNSLKQIIPGHVWRQSGFKWHPETFVCESEKLNEKFIEAEVQNSSLLRFMNNPDLPHIYGIAGNPDDTKAKLFAAYLTHLHILTLKNKANPLWITMYGGFENSLIKEYDNTDKPEPTLLILSNLTPTATNVKLDKTRDILERFTNIPRIVVCAGEDPMSFLTTRLFSPIHGLAYFAENLMKKKVEVI